MRAPVLLDNGTQANVCDTAVWSGGSMKHTLVIALALAVATSFGIVAAQQRQAGPLVEVWKSPTCGCCSKWIEHMRANGFTVKSTDVGDMTKIKAARGVPDQAQSCHTSVVEGYVIEGHVPADDVKRLLKEKPAVVGIAAPGMPVGSPGMETPYVKAERYDVVSFDRKGAMKVFAKH
jgi:hypothetical protein